MSWSLRVQVTRRCQLRCGYCRPDAAQLAEERVLSPAEIARLVTLLVRLGTVRARLTGGEPLLRPDVVEIVERLSAIDGLREVTLTTNGERLALLAGALRAAGLARVNVHIDSLRAERYHALTGGRLERALAGLTAAQQAGLSPKVNMVIQRGANDDELPDFCLLARTKGITVRFIELMDTGIAPEVARARFVPAQEIRAALADEGAVSLPRTNPAPATEYALPGGGRVGIIASESEPFCDDCDRLRLGVDGTLRTCLYAPHGLPLGEMARRGADDGELLAAARTHIASKTSLHPARRPVSLGPPRFSMAAIGG